ncbi:MAG: zinc-binding dehydrogenase [Gammaproteobacteria bacterium]|nr:zinc-binding dehydrogenase [Gammaproteobacteria bacterium]
MKAAWFEQPGDASDVMIIGDREKPQPNAGEVLVRIYASGVNPSDVKKRGGLQSTGLDIAGFVIPHSDGAGIIKEVGEGVDISRVGERVWVYQAQYGRHWGTASEYICVPEKMAARLPDLVDFSVGACMGIPAMTAHRCVFSDGDVAGKTILVTGASGRVGHYAVQWAKLSGATVIGTAGNDHRCRFAKESGADHVFSYQEADLVDRIMQASGGKGVDRIVEVEFGDNIETSIQVLKTSGTIATYSSSHDPKPVLPFYPMMFNNISVQMVLVYNMSDEAKNHAIEDIYRALKKKQLTHRIARTFPLVDIADAHQSIESNSADGCVVVEIK